MCEVMSGCGPSFWFLTPPMYLLARLTFVPVIGELGMHGLDPQGRAAPRVLAMRAAQHSVTLLDEFRNNTLFVRTAPYVVDNETSYNGQYHYNGRADTYFYMGQAMVEGMLQLMKNNREAAGESAIQSER